MENLEGKREEFVTKFRTFLQKNYQKDIAKASEKNIALNIDFSVLDKFSTDLGNVLLNNPESLMEIANDSLKAEQPDFKNKVRFSNVPSPILVRNIRTKQAGKFISIEGIVKKASEIRPEIMQGVWECKDCLQIFTQPRKGAFIFEPSKCPMPGCGSKELTQKESDKVDVRWLTIEEPFELTEGDKPSQILVYLTEDLISPNDRHLSDVGNRLKITGILREIPKGKLTSVRLDFYLDANHVEPVDISWERVEVSKEDAERIRELAKDDKIYEIFVDSLAPSIYGLMEVKEAIILQIFGGVQRTLKDKIKFRGDIHILLIGDAGTGKSQILKLVPEIVPRGRYVSGKGSTSAGLTASVTKDEMFGWTLEAGAVVLANKGLLSIDEFEKMAVEDQVAMHEQMEQGCVSIAKASIVTTLPAKTSILAGGNPKMGRFDPFIAIAKQINIPDTLMSRFDLKFALQDKPNSEIDANTVDHILKSREGNADILPKLSPEFIRKYVAYAKENCKPEFSPETSKVLKDFYIKMRKRAEGVKSVPITLRQFEAMLRLAEASAKIQLSNIVRPKDSERAIRLMTFSLKQLGLDPETQEIDVDRAEGGIPASERGRIRKLMKIIQAKFYDTKEINVRELKEECEKLGMHDIDDAIDQLLKNGEYYKPSPGILAKV
jgi:replicative DNA helicase Mcm